MAKLLGVSDINNWEISLEEIANWYAYYQILPFGDTGEWIRNSRIIQAIYAIGGKQISLDELLPDGLQKKKPMSSAEELLTNLKITFGK